MHKDFIERVGYHAKLPGTEEILQGNFFPPDNMDKYAVQFLSQLKMLPSIQDQVITKAITTKSWQASWKRMKPNTSSSPFRPSFVDYIAGSRNDRIAEFDAIMANIPYVGGYTPKAWILRDPFPRCIPRQRSWTRHMDACQYSIITC
jgi:hypothetical protein